MWKVRHGDFIYVFKHAPQISVVVNAVTRVTSHTTLCSHFLKMCVCVCFLPCSFMTQHKLGEKGRVLQTWEECWKTREEGRNAQIDWKSGTGGMLENSGGMEEFSNRISENSSRDALALQH